MTVAATGRSFTEILQAFAATLAANDGVGLAGLFMPDGVYVDELFGAHHGRAAIAAMLQRFHDTGRDTRWEFIDPIQWRRYRLRPVPLQLRLPPAGMRGTASHLRRDSSSTSRLA